jgi:hypothetical protein
MQMIIDSLFVMFCEDSERNDGSSQKPYYMSKNLLAVRRMSTVFRLIIRFLVRGPKTARSRQKRGLLKCIPRRARSRWFEHVVNSDLPLSLKESCCCFEDKIGVELSALNVAHNLVKIFGCHAACQA